MFLLTEKLIPEVLDVALSSSDRVTRFTACELLHAVVMFMLGTGNNIQAFTILSWIYICQMKLNLNVVCCRQRVTECPP